MIKHHTSSAHARIAFLDRDSLPERIQLHTLSQKHQWENYNATSTVTETIERSMNANVLVTNKVLINDEVLAACPTVGHIAVAATGYNVVDIDACKARGISVSNIPSYASTTVAEHAISCMLVLRRELLQYRQQVIQQQWQRSPTFCLFDKPINDLNGSTIGIIGFGELGQATAKLAHALGMTVLYSSRREYQSEFARHVSLDTLLRDADVVSLHCSLNEQTHHLIGEAELRSMKPNALLINTARGGIADEVAVVNALNNRDIGGIAFDVLSTEPPQDNHPLMSVADRSNVIITPHTAWASEQAMQRLADILVDNVDAYLQGAPRNLVSQ